MLKLEPWPPTPALHLLFRGVKGLRAPLFENSLCRGARAAAPPMVPQVWWAQAVCLSTHLVTATASRSPVRAAAALIREHDGCYRGHSKLALDARDARCTAFPYLSSIPWPLSLCLLFLLLTPRDY